MKHWRRRTPNSLVTATYDEHKHMLDIGIDGDDGYEADICITADEQRAVLHYLDKCMAIRRKRAR